MSLGGKEWGLGYQKHARVCQTQNSGESARVLWQVTLSMRWLKEHGPCPEYFATLSFSRTMVHIFRNQHVVIRFHDDLLPADRERGLLSITVTSSFAA